nr:hypothetical protein [Pantoea cypripedii]
MMIRTLKPCAGLVTRAKRRVKGLNDNQSHHDDFICNHFNVNDNRYHLMGRAGKKFRAFAPKDRRLAFFRIAAG